MKTKALKQASKFSLGLILVAVGLHVARLLADAGAFMHIENRSSLICDKTPTVAGPEDMARLPGTDLVVISSDARDGHWESSGDLFIYDLNHRTLTPLHVHLNDHAPFHPHGLDIWSENGTTTILVVNHRNEEDTTIESFTWHIDQGIQHEKTWSAPLFLNGNDIAAVSADRFYLTSDFSSREGWRRKFEQYARRPSGYISYFDGHAARKVAGDLFFANGIALSEDRRSLLSVEMLGQELHIYEVDSSNGNLKHRDSVKLGFSPDNITLSGSEILFGVHPKLLKLKAMNNDRQQKSPSRVMGLADWRNPHSGLRELLLDDGMQIAASSVALRVSAQRLLIGSVFDDHILDCRARDSKSP